MNPDDIIVIEVLEEKTAPAPQWSTVIPDHAGIATLD